MNRIIFAGLPRAVRGRLADNVWELLQRRRVLSCSSGCEQFDDDELREGSSYRPDFCADLPAIFAVEATLAERGWKGDYVRALANGVCPAWENLKESSELLDFYFAMTHAAPVLRARAAAIVLEDSRNNFEVRREQIH